MARKDARYVYRYERTRRGQEARARAEWEAAGWEIFNVRQDGRFHRELALRRARLKRSRTGSAGPLVVLALAVVAALVAAVLRGPAVVEGAVGGTAAKGASQGDRDNDGLLDLDESLGWRTSAGGVFVTDPDRPDTDGDSLSDGDEAGPPAMGPHVRAVYAGLSDPTEVDSDSDVLDDATERDAGLDPWAGDSDDDGLGDLEEIEFGSDPLSKNADGDDFDDEEEKTEGCDPYGYDLTGKEAFAAFSVGLTGVNPPIGPFALNASQRASWQYLAGSMVRGTAVPLSNLNGFINHLRARQWGRALAEIAKFVPVLGQVAKVLAATAAFAVRSGEAARSAVRLVAGLPVLSSSSKARVIREIVRLAPTQTRLSADAALQDIRASPALPEWRPISLHHALNDEKDEIVTVLAGRGYTDIRVNERQTNASGHVVGINRPDIQATSPGGTRHYYELTVPSSESGGSLMARILSNDADGVVELFEVS